MGSSENRSVLIAKICLALIGVAAVFSTSLGAQEPPVNGRNATAVYWGLDVDNLVYSFEKHNDGTWSQVHLESGTVVDTLQEVGRDDWTIYLRSDAKGSAIGLNLWLKQLTIDGSPNENGKIVRAALSATKTPGNDSGAGSVDLVETGAGIVETGVTKGTDAIFDQVSVTEGPLLEGQTAVDLNNVKDSPNSTLKNMCSILQVASSTIKGQVDNAEQRKAQEKVVDQWVDILYDAQMESGVSIESVEPGALINTMAQIQTDIEKDAPEAAETQEDLISTGFSVNDPDGALKPGAVDIPVDGPAQFMILNKTIVFDGVSGSYKLTTSYDGGAGTIHISPGLTEVPAHNTSISTEPEWTSFDIARMTLEIAGIADPTGTVAVAAAYLHPVCNTEEANRSRGDYCYRHSDTRGVGVIPVGCNPALPDHQAGLCYKPCADGYNGVGPVCWTSEEVSIPRGAGVIPAGCPESHPIFEAGLCYQACDPGWKAVGTICYQECPDGYSDDGLYCGKTTYGRGAGYVIWDQEKCENDNPDVGCEKIGALWYPKCKPGFEMTTVNFCQTKGCPSGFEDIGVSCKMPSKGRGVGVVRNVCAADVPDLDAGLCYQNCPEGYKGVGPVCWTQKSVSQPRGVGLVPDQCAPSHPEFDAGLCYQECPNTEYAGIGPVCWGGCGGRYPEECGVGCATSAISCGIVTTEMVVAPLEAVASILSLGGYSLVDKAKDSAKKGLKEAVDAADGPAAKAFGQTVGQQAAVALKKNLDKLDNLSKGLTKRKDAIVKAIKDKTLDPVKDRASKAWVKGAQNRLDNKAAKLAKDFEKELIQSGAQPDELDKLVFEKVAKSTVEAEAAEKAAAKALKEASPKVLERREIRDKILAKLSQSWNNTDKAWIAVGQQCTEMGLNIADDWMEAQP